MTPASSADCIVRIAGHKLRQVQRIAVIAGNKSPGYRRPMQAGEQQGKVRLDDSLIGVHDEDPIASAMSQRFISSGGKIIRPRVVEHLSPAAGCNLYRAV